MKKEDRELLVRDLCARLPYNTIISVTNDDDNRNTIQYLVEEDIKDLRSTISYSGNTYKPYLFPLSSLDKDVLEKLNDYGFFKYHDTITNVSCIESNNGISEEIYTYVDIDTISVLIEFFHANHIDYRNLISKGLALDATGLNIY